MLQPEALNGTSAAEIHKKLVNAHGEANVITLRQVQRIASDFKDGQRNSFERKEGSGRPRTSRSEDNVEKVRELIEGEPSLSISSISSMLNIHASTVQRILEIDLKKKS